MKGAKPMTLSDKVYYEIKKDVNSLAFSSNEFINENAMAERYGHMITC
jgi:DNA-binding GntR family transcriptional regulator